ncbi:bifunctional helix-turn-helix transcriptional regulator/GNAT family N-acetyltransferase [Haloactinopolyspora sp.]|uniref:bifunctional helix-turn-helix transcriptional regulator/GNAT family N-acetyltransferase n=1 Tax=Haloactinopolyspora sp. TaxID=1966353 RepID=UPI00261F1710|nr:bifunctional helix-turn-helix transcriptional regulator/GNAT family N-acetyltransferase [Haloactinopolyspora sp.]
MDADTSARVASVRSFNRFYTSVMGFLDQGLLMSRHTLTEARVIFELAQQPESDVADVRSALGIDAGQLSRILARLDSAGLVDRSRSSADGRRLRASLTQAGRDAFATLDSRSNRQAEKLLSSLSEHDQRRLIAAFATVRELLDDGADDDSRATYVLRGLRNGDLGWVVQRNGALYAEEYGWDETYEALVARIVADYGASHDPRRENAWIAELDGRRAGAVFCMRKDDKTAQLRLLHVEPSARGDGLGKRLVDECVTFARNAHYEAITLWTNNVLTAARHIYQKTGFELVEQEPHHSFGHDLVGEVWRLDLRRA